MGTFLLKMPFISIQSGTHQPCLLRNPPPLVQDFPTPQRHPFPQIRMCVLVWVGARGWCNTLLTITHMYLSILLCIKHVSKYIDLFGCPGRVLYMYIYRPKIGRNCISSLCPSVEAFRVWPAPYPSPSQLGVEIHSPLLNSKILGHSNLGITEPPQQPSISLDPSWKYVSTHSGKSQHPHAEKMQTHLSKCKSCPSTVFTRSACRFLSFCSRNCSRIVFRYT